MTTKSPEPSEGAAALKCDRCQIKLVPFPGHTFKHCPSPSCPWLLCPECKKGM